MTVLIPQAHDSLSRLIHFLSRVRILTILPSRALPPLECRTKGRLLELWLLAQFIYTVRIEASISSIMTSSIQEEGTYFGLE